MAKKKLPAKAPITVPEIDWEGELKAILKAELKLRRMTYDDLIERLGKMSIPITQQNLRNKISRGTFSAVFLMQCLVAMGCLHLRLGDSDTSNSSAARTSSAARRKRTDSEFDAREELLNQISPRRLISELASINQRELLERISGVRRVPSQTSESILASIRPRRVPRP